VLEASGDEGRDREHDREDPVGDGAAGERDPDGQADEQVAQHALHERFPERLTRLGRRDHYVLRADQPAVQRRVVREKDDQRQSGRAHRIADVDDRPVARELAGGDPPARPGHHHQVVAGEELRPRDDH